MKLTVFGATGGTGQEIVKQALAAGHSVTAVVRGDASRLAAPGLKVVTADVMDPHQIEQAVSGADVVINTIGTRVDGPTSVVTDSSRSIMTAMTAAGVKRLVSVSASGPFREDDGFVLKHLIKPIVCRILRHPFADFEAAEKLILGSSLEWTIVRPPQLTDKPATGNYRVGKGSARGNGLTGYRVSRADLAHCLLRTAADPRSSRTIVSIAN